jgi:hypothetical protein
MLEKHLLCHSNGYTIPDGHQFCTLGREYSIFEYSDYPDIYMIVDDLGQRRYFSNEKATSIRPHDIFEESDYKKYFHFMVEVGQSYVNPLKYVIDTITNQTMIEVFCSQLNEVGIYNLKRFLVNYNNKISEKWLKIIESTKENRDKNMKYQI